MKKHIFSFVLIVVLVTPFFAVASVQDPIKIVSSFTIITDMAEAIGGDLVTVYNLVPTGTDPHEYELRPNDIKAATDADLLFYNGLNLEGGTSGWFLRMVKSVKQNPERVFALNDGVEPRYLRGATGQEAEINPHSFLSPRVGMVMAENLRDALMAYDPDNAEFYQANADSYLQRLAEIDGKYTEVINSIPENRRILVTSERAFQYLTEDYGLREAYVWEIDTEDQGTARQIMALIDLLRTEQPPVLFLESNVDPKPLQTVAKETGIPIFEQRIYSDEIGTKGQQVDTYIKLLEHNLSLIEAGLG